MLNVEVMRMLQIVVSKLPSKLNSEHWDFVMCSAVSWIQVMIGSGSTMLMTTSMKSAYKQV